MASLQVPERDTHKIRILGKTVDLLRSNYYLPENGKKFEMIMIFKAFAISILFGIPVHVGILGHIYITLKRGIWPDPIYSLMVFLTIIQVQFILAVYMGNYRDSLINAKRMNEFSFGIPKESRKLHELYEKLTPWLYNIAKIMCFFQIFYHYFNRSFCSHPQLKTDHGYVCSTPIPLWYPVNMNYPGMKIILSTCIAVISSTYLPPTLLITNSYLINIAMITIRVKELRNIIIKNTRRQNTLTEKQLMLYIKHQSEIMDCIVKMNNDFGYTHLLIFLLRPVMLAILLYRIVIQFEKMCVVHFMVWTIPITLLCLSGERLQHQGFLLSDTIYDIPWYDMDLRLKKNFYVFFQRSQIPLLLKVKPLEEINHRFLYQLYKGVYSFLVYLKNTGQNEK